MRVATTLGALVLCAACGGGEPEPGTPARSSGAASNEAVATRETPAGAANRPPHVSGASLQPREPRRGDAISAAVRVMDPDGDPLSFDVEWFWNGEPAQRGSDLTFAPQGLRRGDSVHAIVHVRDEKESTTVELEPVLVRNTAPKLGSVKLLPDRPTSALPLVVQAQAFDADDDAVELEYAWFRGEEKIADQSSASLPAGLVRRGDKVRVQITPRDEYEGGDRFFSQPVQIQNGAPEIRSTPAQVMAGPDRYEYQVEAKDPDGDTPLRYELVSGPPGMSVDFVSGLVSWTVPPGMGGHFDVQLSVSDVYGEKTLQSYGLDLAWEGVN